MTMLLIRALLGQGFKTVSIEEYRSGMGKGNGSPLLIDVRTSAEFKAGHVKGARSLPLDQLSARMSELPHGEPIALICASGNRSRFGSAILAEAGFAPVINIQGGTDRWVRLGFPVTR